MKSNWSFAEKTKQNEPFFDLTATAEKICINFKFQFAVGEKIKKNYASQEKTEEFETSANGKKCRNQISRQQRDSLSFFRKIFFIFFPD